MVNGNRYRQLLPRDRAGDFTAMNSYEPGTVIIHMQIKTSMLNGSTRRRGMEKRNRGDCETAPIACRFPLFGPPARVMHSTSLLPENA